MKPLLTPLHRAIRGFTLVETMVAVMVLGLATMGIVAFTRTGLKMYYADRARLTINRDIRTFTARMDSDAVSSNFFFIYADFNTRTTGTGSATADAPLADGQAGDFLVLVYTDPSATNQGISMITRLVGYYREQTNTFTSTNEDTGQAVTTVSGPVHRFDIDLSAAPVNVKSAPMYTILANAVTGGISSYPIIEQLAQNQTSTTTTPRLFYNFNNRSVLISAQIAESLTERGTTLQAGNTYNFSVSPRG
jgi:prepilin-type N-terminal cleavage/methylation domain-containing protein